MERLDGTLFARVQLRQVVAPVFRAATQTTHPAAFDEAHDLFEQRFEQFRLQGLMVASLDGCSNPFLALLRDGMILGAGCGAHVGLGLARGAADTMEALATVPPRAAGRLLAGLAPLAGGVASTTLAPLSAPLGMPLDGMQQRLAAAGRGFQQAALSSTETLVVAAAAARNAVRFCLTALACTLGAGLGAAAGGMMRAAVLLGFGLAGLARVAGHQLGRLTPARLKQPGMPLLRWLPERIAAIDYLTAGQTCVRAMPHNLAHALERRRIEQAFWHSTMQLASAASSALADPAEREQALAGDSAGPAATTQQARLDRVFHDVEGELRNHRQRMREAIVEYRRDCQRAFHLDPGQLLSPEQARALRLDIESGTRAWQPPRENAEAHAIAMDGDDLWCMRQEWLLLRNPGLATQRPDAEDTRTVFAVRAETFEQMHDARRGLCKMIPLPRSTDIGSQIHDRHKRLEISRSIEQEIFQWLETQRARNPRNARHGQLRAKLDHLLSQQALYQTRFYHLVDDLSR